MGATRFSKVDGNKAFFGMRLTDEAVTPDDIQYPPRMV